MNPIAKALHKKRLMDLLRDTKIRLYMLDNGDPCEEVCYGVGQTLSIMGLACELDPKVDSAQPDLRILLGAMSACQQMAKANRWDKLQTVAIVNGIDAAVRLNKQVRDKFILRAYTQLMLQ